LTDSFYILISSKALVLNISRGIWILGARELACHSHPVGGIFIAVFYAANGLASDFSSATIIQALQFKSLSMLLPLTLFDAAIITANNGRIIATVCHKVENSGANQSLAR
jgi:hypothetical protein